MNKIAFNVIGLLVLPAICIMLMVSLDPDFPVVFLLPLLAVPVGGNTALVRRLRRLGDGLRRYARRACRACGLDSSVSKNHR